MNASGIGELTDAVVAVGYVTPWTSSVKEKKPAGVERFWQFRGVSQGTRFAILPMRVCG